MRLTRRIVVAFIALAILQGFISALLSQRYADAMQGQTLTATALVSALAAVVLLAWTIARRQSLPSPQQWLALLLLASPQLLAILLEAPYTSWAHPAGWAAIFFLLLAAPLWLALLTALRVLDIEVPRAVSAASIIGIGAVCLVVPTVGYAVMLDTISNLLLHLLLTLLTVYSWAFARTRLAPLTATAAAGASLLLGATSSAVLAFISERPYWHPIDRHGLLYILPLVLLATAAGTCLWFWLLTHMALPAFSMNTLALWIAATLGSAVLYGFLTWRVDFAIMIAVTALIVALRARVSDEQPLALGIAQR